MLNFTAMEPVAQITPATQTVSKLSSPAEGTKLAPLDAFKATFIEATSFRSVPQPGSAELWAQNVCCDYMMTCTWTAEHGWHTPEVKPYADFTISPIASCLHYATQCFEGMKAYRGFDGQLRLFRPDRNAARLEMSAERVALPCFDHGELVKLIKKVVRINGPRKSLSAFTKFMIG